MKTIRLFITKKFPNVYEECDLIQESNGVYIENNKSETVCFVPMTSIACIKYRNNEISIVLITVERG